MLYEFFNAPETDLFSGNTHEMMSWFKAVWGRSTRGKYVLFERLDVGLNNTCGGDYSSGGGHVQGVLPDTLSPGEGIVRITRKDNSVTYLAS